MQRSAAARTGCECRESSIEHRVSALRLFGSSAGYATCQRAEQESIQSSASTAGFVTDPEARRRELFGPVDSATCAQQRRPELSLPTLAVGRFGSLRVAAASAAAAAVANWPIDVNLGYLVTMSATTPMTPDCIHCTRFNHYVTRRVRCVTLGVWLGFGLGSASGERASGRAWRVEWIDRRLGRRPLATGSG